MENRERASQRDKKQRRPIWLEEKHENFYSGGEIMFFAVRFIWCVPLVVAVQLSVHVYFNKFSQQCKMKTSRQTSKKQQNAFTPTLGMAREYSKVCVEWTWIEERLPVFLLSMEWVSDKVHILLIPVFMCPLRFETCITVIINFAIKPEDLGVFHVQLCRCKKVALHTRYFSLTERKCALSEHSREGH